MRIDARYPLRKNIFVVTVGFFVPATEQTAMVFCSPANDSRTNKKFTGNSGLFQAETLNPET